MTNRGESGLSVTLYGANGLTWDLLSRYSPVWIKGGLGGLHFMETEAVVTTAARIPGQRLVGTNIKARRLPMTLLVGDQNPPYRVDQDWRNLDSRFWESLPIQKYVTLQVDDEYEGRRTLECRLDSSVVAYEKDPAIIGKQTYDIELVADWPFWAGPTRTFTFAHSGVPDQNYYGGSGGGGHGPPFYIGASSSFQSATVANDGDEDAWVKWALTGPGIFTVGTGDALINIPLTLTSGQQVFIDTDPRKQTITNAVGDNLWPSMGSAQIDFAPIPTGRSVLVTVEVTSPGVGSQVDVEVTPQFHRAWGYRG